MVNDVTGLGLARAVWDFTTGDARRFCDRLALVIDAAEQFSDKISLPTSCYYFTARRPSLPRAPFPAPSSRSRRRTISLSPINCSDALSYLAGVSKSVALLWTDVQSRQRTFSTASRSSATCL